MITKFTVSESTTMYGLHTDTKPTGTGVLNGSAFIEMDTGKIYFFDADGAVGSEWIEWGASS